MAIFSGMLGALGKSIMEGFASSVGRRAVNYGEQKILGIPAPQQPKTGAALGIDQRAAMDQAFPGTNPWERLGAPGYAGAGVEAAKQTGKVQQKMQDKELSTRRQIANIQADAHVQAAATSVGPRAVASALQTRRGARGEDYTTANMASATQSYAQAVVIGHKATIVKEEARLAKQMADAKLTSQQVSNTQAAVLNAIKEINKTGPGQISTSVAAKAGAGAIADAAISRFPIVRRFFNSFAR